MAEPPPPMVAPPPLTTAVSSPFAVSPSTMAAPPPLMVAPPQNPSSAAAPPPPSSSPIPPPLQARRPQPWKPSAVFEHLPPPPFVKISAEGIASGDIRGLHALARQGSWHAVLDKTKAALAPTGSNPNLSGLAAASQVGTQALGSPTWLSLKAYQILALVKLRTYRAADDELKALGDLDDPRYNTAVDGSSAVPHALRVLAAELPWLLGQPARSVDMLYELSDRCAREIAAAEGEGSAEREIANVAEVERRLQTVDISGARAGTAKVWRRRRDAALHAAVNIHVSNKEHLAALARLDWMARCRDGPDPTILSLAGRVHLQLGDLDGAQLCFDAAKAAVDATSDTASASSTVDSPDASLQCKLDAGLLAFARKDYVGAKKLFEAVLAVHPWDATAASNLAVVCMYTRDLRGGVRTLEEALTCHTAAAVQHEALLGNLSSMYDVAAAVPIGAKRTLLQWVTNVQPADLDPACTRLSL